MSEDFIQSYSGKALDFLDPKEDQIDIEDIAHALSLLCRFGGHCRTFYSVADHSIRCAEYAEPKFKLEALLHDATEAYLVDMPRPIKKVLVGYRDIENSLDKIVRKKFNLPPSMSSEVHLIDNKMLATEKRDLMKPSERSWLELPDPYEEVINPRTYGETYELFLQTYNEIVWGMYGE